MPASDPLGPLRALDISSADSPDKVAELLCDKEYQECIPNLRGRDLAWLVEFLDDVHLYIPYPPSV